MAGLVRKTSIQFGNAGPTSSFGQFGSKQAGTPQTSQDPAVIQGLPARWQQGWQSAVVASDKAAYIEDMNGFCFVDSYQLTYLFQMGIPEWDSGTRYFTNSYVQTQSNGQIFRSLQGGVPGVGAGQLGNAPPASASNAFWLWINPPQDLVGTATLNKVPKVTNTAPANGIPGSVLLGDSAITEDGVNVGITLPLKFPDNTIQSTAAVANPGPPTGEASTTAIGSGVTSITRVLGTVYQNTGTKPRYVTVTANVAGNTCTAFCDLATTPTQVVGYIAATAGDNIVSTITFIVLPNFYYFVSGGSGIQYWTEWS